MPLALHRGELMAKKGNWTGIEIPMNPFDSYMLNKVRRLKDVRTQYAATGEKALLAGVPEEDREFVTTNTRKKWRGLMRVDGA